MIIKHGSRGRVVEQLQINLNATPPTTLPKLSEDGIFGRKTARRVKEFQRTYGLLIDGIVGPKTQSRLSAELQRTSPSLTNANPISTLPSVRPKVSTVFYLHSHDVPGKGVTMTKHSGKRAHHLIYTQEVSKRYKGNIFDAALGQIHNNNYSVTDFVLNAHGYGQGTVSFGKKIYRLIRHGYDFRRLRKHFESNGEIWIYSCLFVNSKFFKDPDGDSNDFDAGFWNGREKKHSGPGIDALKVIARNAGVPVYAGFSLQTGISGAYVGHYVKVNSAGSFAIFKGNPLPGYHTEIMNKMYTALFS